jgi:hypothetical protein
MAAKNKKRFVRHEQWIEIMRVEGKTVTVYYPPNEEFEQLRLKLDPPADLIYRRLNFIHGVPPEYLWTDPPADIQQYGGHFLQRITPEEWPIILQAERKSKTGLVIPATNAQPRPEVLGPCPCDKCTQEREQGKPSRYSSNINISD